MKNIILLSLLFVMFMGVVYGAMVATGSQQHSDMTGKIIGILVADNNSANTNSILVQGVLTNGNQQGNVSVRITNETQILRKKEIRVLLFHVVGLTSNRSYYFQPTIFPGGNMGELKPQYCGGVER